jgi:outer membrane protein assembly factor BamB
MRQGMSVALLVLLMGAAGCAGSASHSVARATSTSTLQATNESQATNTPQVSETATAIAQLGACHPADSTAPLPSTFSTIYAETPDHYVVALNAGDGSLRWRYATGVANAPTLIASGALLYVIDVTGAAGSGGSVVALGAADGAVRWWAHFPTENGREPTLTVANGSVYVGALDGVHALNGASGVELWHFQTSDSSTPVTAINGIVYVQVVLNAQMFTSAVYALRASSGTQIWSYEPASSPFTPAVANRLVYVAASASQLVSLDADTGAVRWRFDVDTYQQPVSLEGVTIAGTGAYVNAFHKIYALDTSSGALCWQATACGQGATTLPLLSGGLLYSGCFYGDPGPGSPGPGCAVFALDAGSGAAHWTFNVTGFPRLSPASLVGGSLFISGTLQVWAVNASTGVARWSFPAQPQSRQTASVIVVGTTAYTGTYDGSIYGLNADTGSVRWHAGGGSVAMYLVTVGP